MSTLRISLRHADLMHTPCSLVFMKHIEGTMSGPESALDAVTQGQLKALYAQHEQEHHQILFRDAPHGRVRTYIINFHKNDLPFSYRSVDRYAREMLRVLEAESPEAAGALITVLTPIHGPGAGLDASESMETLVLALADELSSRSQPAFAAEVILVEKEKEVFDRLQERLKYLAARSVVTFDGVECHVNPGKSQTRIAIDERRVQQLSLRHLFVAMPYAKEFNNAYYFGIKQPIELRGRKCERVDQDAFTGDIVERIKTRIRGAELVIADITGNNPNVFFEVGYAEGLGKRVILLSQTQETPFDLRSRSQIRYDPLEVLSLAEALSKQLDANLDRSDESVA